MNKVRLGIVGVGNMGSVHARSIQAGKIRGLELTALADSNPERLTHFADVPAFATPEEMIASGAIDAVLIATPHYQHSPLGILTLEAGLHLLVEKPIGVHKAEAERLIAAAASRPKQVFGVDFNQRTDPAYQKIRHLIMAGEIGAIRRINWTVTDWFRPAAYYASGGWRATWAGEGGGVLLNQSPHNLDLLQWLFGLPVRVRAHCGFGRHHDIEVEDEVTAYLEFDGGATGIFITSTGEAPGTNRLEIAGDQARLVFENNAIHLVRNLQPVSEFSRATSEPFSRPETREETIAATDRGGQHNEILQNFTDAILSGVALIAPGAEGIRSVELANGMLLSAWTGETVSLPVDAAVYARHLADRVAASSRHLPTAPAEA